MAIRPSPDQLQHTSSSTNNSLWSSELQQLQKRMLGAQLLRLQLLDNLRDLQAQFQLSLHLNSATISRVVSEFPAERRIQDNLVATVVPLEEAMRHVPATMTSPV